LLIKISIKSKEDENSNDNENKNEGLLEKLTSKTPSNLSEKTFQFFINLKKLGKSSFSYLLKKSLSLRK